MPRFEVAVAHRGQWFWLSPDTVLGQWTFQWTARP